MVGYGFLSGISARIRRRAFVPLSFPIHEDTLGFNSSLHDESEELFVIFADILSLLVDSLKLGLNSEFETIRPKSICHLSTKQLLSLVGRKLRGNIVFGS